MAENKVESPAENPKEGPRPLPAAALRALQEADARRKAYLQQEAGLPREISGRGGLEPVRYGDWEIKGIAADF